MSGSVSFTSTGAAQSWTVPSDIANDRVAVELYGANSSTSGCGYVYGELLATASDALNLYVGGLPGAVPTGTAGAAGGFNGGGTGGSATASGGIGGLGGYGATDIRKGGTGTANRVAVAGGAGANGRNGNGGGNGGNGGAGGGGESGGNGTGTSAGTNGIGGAGGTQTAGGNGGATAGATGSQTSGGNGGGTSTAANGRGGGGGGGGYYGGGGGGASSTGTGSGGGGGGSNYVGGLATVNSNFGGVIKSDPGGLITIRYVLKTSLTLLYLNNPDGERYDTNYNVDSAKSVRVFARVNSNESGGVPDFVTRVDYRWRPLGSSTWNTITNVTYSKADGSTAGVYVGDTLMFDVPANTFAGLEGQQVEFQMLSYGGGLYNDGSGQAGSWSTSDTIRPRNRPAAPTWTQTAIATNPPKLSFTSPSSGIAYSIQLTDNAGNNVPAVGTDTGKKTVTGLAPSTSRSNVDGPTYPYQNQTNYRLKVKYAVYQSLWSDSTDSGSVLANINAPKKPTLLLIPIPASAAIQVVVTNPGSDSYPPTKNRVYRTRGYLADGAGVTEDLVADNVAVNGTFVDYLAGANQPYRYRVEAVNSTTYTSSD